MLNGDRVRQAREIRGMTQSTLASLVGIHQSNVARIEQNGFFASDSLVKGIALHTDFPENFLTQDAAPDFPLGSLLFRKRGSLKSQEKYKVRQLARLVYELFAKLSANFRAYDTKIPALREPAALAAKITRSALGYSPDLPITDLVHRLERHGVIVLALPVDLADHDAFSLWVDDDPPRPLLVITAGKPGDRLRFNLAHELGHLVLHRSAASSLADMEGEANAFAAEFLMPREVLRREFPIPLTLSGLADMKKKWGISIQALALRARDIGVVTDRQYKYLVRQLSMKGWRQHEPVHIEPEKPRLLRKMVELVYGTSDFAARAADLVNAPPTLIEQVVDCFAGPPSTSHNSATQSNNVIVFAQR
jgi:Zn-dependent peptidase ImmA (M78 family)